MTCFVQPTAPKPKDIQGTIVTFEKLKMLVLQKCPF